MYIYAAMSDYLRVKCCPNSQELLSLTGGWPRTNQLAASQADIYIYGGFHMVYKGTSH